MSWVVSWLAAWAAPLATTLLWASLEGALLIALVALLVRALPQLPAAVRCALWWAACLKLLLALAWPLPLELPWLPATASPAPPEMAATSAAEMAATPAGAAAAAPPGTAATAAQGGRPERAATPSAPSAPTPPEMAAILGIALWAGVLVVLAVHAGRQLAHLRRTLGDARPVDDPVVLARLATLARRAGVAPPELRVSRQVTAPHLTGLWRPAILLPTQAVRGDADELDMILAHELAHLRRRDLAHGWVPALAARLFFFHPLAALAAREYALAREAACDAEALRLVGAAPRDYGRMLLTWGATRQAGLPAAASLGDTHHLKRRLLMLEQTTTRHGRRWPLLTLAALLPVLLLLLPVRLTPAEAGPGPTPDEGRHTWSWSAGDGEPLVILRGDDTLSFNAGQDARRRAEAARRGAQDLAWFERGGSAYVIRDAATLETLRQAVEPVLDLAKQQGELGAKQGELGGEQGELGGEQGELGAEMGRLGAEMGALGAELAVVVSKQVVLEMGDADEDAVAELEAEEETIEAEMEALEAKMEALGEQMEALGEQQEALGARQAEMGERQAELGRKQAEASEKATAEVDRILEQAVRAGTAERVD